MDKAEQYFRMQQAAFECASLAYYRKDAAAHEKARKLHRKYTHLWEQAMYRALRATEKRKA